MKITGIELKNIPNDADYEGYLWWSNEEKPQVFLSEKLGISLPEKGQLPAIIEGFLYCKESKTSYSIRFLDEGYLVMKYEIDKNEPGDVSEFIPNRLPGVSKIKFLQYWEVENDPLCAGFEVLKPKANVFVGFEMIGG